MADTIEMLNLSLSTVLLLILLLVALGIWLQLALLRGRVTVRLTRLEERLAEQEQLLEIQTKGVRDLAETCSRLADVANDSKTVLESIRLDTIRLADDVRGEVGMSKAIELARAGAGKAAVADATGMSLEEAEAIVTFHGRK
ncbi:MAG: hypothetical protein GWP36_01950 [Bacteroidetes bacterium]|jgi:predicted Holliday junction resolvase-like endonuclease|nr:hypothetical protein [Bacteroidota bacterium]